MSKTLFHDADNGQDNFFTVPNSTKNMPKKTRPKFTILDDMEQLNEIINGPGANEQSIKAQQLITKTYKCMKDSPITQQNELDAQYIAAEQQHKRSRNKQPAKFNQQKQNLDNNSVLRYRQAESIDQLLKYISGPRIRVFQKRIDLDQKFTPDEFKIKGSQRYNCSDAFFSGPRAPANSIKDQSGMLFQEALNHQNTDRAKLKSSNQTSHKVNTPQISMNKKQH